MTNGEQPHKRLIIALYEEVCMDKEKMIGNWNEIKGKVKEKFGKLTDDDIMQIQGKRDQLVGAIQKKYACSKEKAESDLNSFMTNLRDAVKFKSEETEFDVPRKTGTEG